MINLLQKLVDCINASDINVDARLAYNNEFMKRPVLKQAVYITLDEIKGSVASFVAYVYSPVSVNGSNCLKAAQLVCKVLNAETNDFFVTELTLNGVDYCSDSVAFMVKINGTVCGYFGSDVSLGGYSVRAFAFSNNAELAVDIFTENISVVCDYSPYPVMTICSGKAIDTVEGDKSYSITLSGISERLLNTLCSNGVFTLQILRGGIAEKYLKCCCKKSEINSNLGSDKSYLTVISYEKIIENTEEVSFDE